MAKGDLLPSEKQDRERHRYKKLFVVISRRRLIWLEHRIYVTLKMTIMSESPFFWVLQMMIVTANMDGVLNYLLGTS